MRTPVGYLILKILIPDRHFTINNVNRIELFYATQLIERITYTFKLTNKNNLKSIIYIYLKQFLKSIIIAH